MVKIKNQNLRSIIDFAVDNELEAYEFYRDAAVKAEDSFLKQTFEELAEEELEHKKFLEDLLISESSDFKLDDFTDYKVSETIDKPKLSVEMKFSEALALAIKNEEEAMQMYESLSRDCSDEKNKELFEGLMKMEQLHKSRLEEIYLNAAYGEVW